MKLNIELELVADYHEDDNDRVTLTSLSFPDCSQNLMVFMSPEKIEEAQEALREAVQDAAIAKVERLLEQRGARLGQYRSPRTGE
jgi:hypothetical protein